MILPITTPKDLKGPPRLFELSTLYTQKLQDPRATSNTGLVATSRIASQNPDGTTIAPDSLRPPGL